MTVAILTTVPPCEARTAGAIETGLKGLPKIQRSKSGCLVQSRSASPAHTAAN